MSQILSPEARERRQSIALSAPLRLSAHVCSRPNEISSAVLTRELVSVPAVSRIALVKPDRARAIEQLLMRMAQSGQLRGRVSEDQLIDVLDQVRTLTPRRSSRGHERGADERECFDPQVEAMEKGQGGGAQKSGSKITVSRTFSTACLAERGAPAALPRSPVEFAWLTLALPVVAVHEEVGVRQRRRLVRGLEGTAHACIDRSDAVRA